jgi:hypothetical protein
MARTVAEIKKTMTDEFMNSTVMATKYGFTAGDSFDSTFSKVSVESIWFYTVSFGIAVFEKFFDIHKSEVADLIAAERTHTLRWYANKALLYMHGYSLIEDSDTYDTSTLTDDEISAAKVVKNASAVEKANVVYVKVKGSDGKLTDDQEEGIIAYFKEVKDAGVKLEIINRDADHYKGTIDIFYNPMVLNSNGFNTEGAEPVRDAVNAFIAALPFNGEFRHDDFIIYLNSIDGVVIPQLNYSQYSADGLSFYDIDGFFTPDAGYMKIYNDTDLTINYKVYETVSD